MSGRFSANKLDRKEFGSSFNIKHKLKEKDLKIIKDSFYEHDKQNTHEVDIDELKQALDKYGIEYQNDEAFQKIFDEAEKKGNCNLDFDELINIVTSRMSDIDSMNELQKVFLLFLGDENVDKIEFRHIRNECPNLTDEEIKQMIEKADEDKDGKINFEEFYNIVTKLI